MILNAEKAVVEYLEAHMTDIIGSGNDTIAIYPWTFPDDSHAEGISVFCEFPDNDDDIPELYLVGIRIITRSPNSQTAFILMQNVDLLLDKMVLKNLNSGVQLCLCKRNSGPDRFVGVNNYLTHYAALYSMTLRRR